MCHAKLPRVTLVCVVCDFPPGHATKPGDTAKKNGHAPTQVRTVDLAVNSHTLDRLSYGGVDAERGGKGDGYTKGRGRALRVTELPALLVRANHGDPNGRGLGARKPGDGGGRLRHGAIDPELKPTATVHGPAGQRGELDDTYTRAWNQAPVLSPPRARCLTWLYKSWNVGVLVGSTVNSRTLPSGSRKDARKASVISKQECVRPYRCDRNAWRHVYTSCAICMHYMTCARACQVARASFAQQWCQV